MSKHRDTMGVGRDAKIESYIRESVKWYLRNSTIKLSHPRVIDVGANYGYAMSLFKEQGWKVKGLDIEPQKLIPRIVVEKWPMEDLTDFVHAHDFDPDLFFFNHTLEHTKHPWKIMQKVHTLLSSGGEVFIAAPSPKSIEWVAAGHYSLFSLEFLRFMLKEAGFTEVASQTLMLRMDHEEVQIIGKKR